MKNFNNTKKKMKHGGFSDEKYILICYFYKDFKFL